MLFEELIDTACSESAGSLDSSLIFDQLENIMQLRKQKNGQSMQRLWNHFRGSTYSNSLQSDLATQLANLSDRFDDLKWKQPSLEIEELLNVQDNLITASSCLISSNNMDDLLYRVSN